MVYYAGSILAGVAATPTITSPTSAITYDAGTATTIDLGGTALCDNGVTSVTWQNNLGGTGTATGTTSWTISGLPLTVGTNVITVTAHGNGGATNTDVITVTRASAGSGPSITSVSGSLTHGSTLTINGSGFGIHADYGGSQSFLNAAFNSFETGLEVGNFRIDPDYASQNGVNLSTANPRGGASTQHYRKTYATVGGSPRLGSIHHPISGSNTVFRAGGWFRMGSDTLGTPSKFFRHYYGASPRDYYIGAGNHSSVEFYAMSEQGGVFPGAQPTSVFGTALGADPFNPYSTWRHFETLCTLTGGTSMFGSSDYLEARLSNQRMFRRGGQLASNHIAAEGSLSNENEQYVGGSSGDSDGHTIDFADLLDTTGGSNVNNFYDWDDIYVDYTLACVRIGSASTYAACTGFEYQIPLVWNASGTQIQIQLNRGALTLAGSYLYVVNASNEVNATGFLLT